MREAEMREPGAWYPVAAGIRCVRIPPTPQRGGQKGPGWDSGPGWWLEDPVQVA